MTEKKKAIWTHKLDLRPAPFAAGSGRQQLRQQERDWTAQLDRRALCLRPCLYPRLPWCPRLRLPAPGCSKPIARPGPEREQARRSLPSQWTPWSRSSQPNRTAAAAGPLSLSLRSSSEGEGEAGLATSTWHRAREARRRQRAWLHTRRTPTRRHEGTKREGWQEHSQVKRTRSRTDPRSRPFPQLGTPPHRKEARWLCGTQHTR